MPQSKLSPWFEVGNLESPQNWLWSPKLWRIFDLVDAKFVQIFNIFERFWEKSWARQIFLDLGLTISNLVKLGQICRIQNWTRKILKIPPRTQTRKGQGWGKIRFCQLPLNLTKMFGRKINLGLKNLKILKRQQNLSKHWDNWVSPFIQKESRQALLDACPSQWRRFHVLRIFLQNFGDEANFGDFGILVQILKLQVCDARHNNLGQHLAKFWPSNFGEIAKLW